MTARWDRGRDLVGEVGDFAPIEMVPVERYDQRLLFRELVGKHHYLGHAVPFGAPLRYLVYASRPERTVVGCVQFSTRGQIIGPDDLPPNIRSPIGSSHDPSHGPASLAEMERLHIARVLSETGGRKMKAARLLGIDLKTLNHKIKLYKIHPPN